MKVCTKCGETKLLSEYYKEAARRLPNARCKDCVRAARREYGRNQDPAKKTAYNKSWHGTHVDERREYHRDRRALLQAFIRSIKRELGCADCGINEPLVLQFDHRDPDSKKGTIGKKFAAWGPKTIREEIAKCDVVCANCHIMRHSQTPDLFKKRQYHI